VAGVAEADRAYRRQNLTKFESSDKMKKRIFISKKRRGIPQGEVLHNYVQQGELQNVKKKKQPRDR
jgi:hypothetical protein